MNALYVLTLPHLGEGVDSADVSEVLVSVGDKIKTDDPVVVLESEKASMEIPIDTSGTVKEVFVKEGTTLSAGDEIISVQRDKVEKGTDLESQPNTEKDTKDINTHPPINTPNISINQEEKEKNFRTSPSVRKLSRELNINLSTTRGTGKKGRITRDDLINKIKEKMKTPSAVAQKEIDFSQWGPIKTQALNKIKKITGQRLEFAWQSIPQVTQFDKADITELDKYRREINENKKTKKITFLPFLIKAAVQTLKEFPEFNCSLSADKETLIFKNYYHISIAVNTSDGLVVPVIKNADKQNIKSISEALGDMSKRARQKTLTPDYFMGGTFTISSLGGIGGTYFTPIVNPPQVAILGVSRSVWEPLFSKQDNKFIPRLILPFSISYDHRVIDGAAAALFTKHFQESLLNVGGSKHKK
jgi:pyruvate dehydrogenase E2 component (dihydrolipoamide acetyltransferase)